MSKLFIITNDINFIEIDEQNILSSKEVIDCKYKSLIVQNDINMKSGIFKNDEWTNYYFPIQILDGLNLILYNEKNSSINNPIFEDITNFFKEIKIKDIPLNLIEIKNLKDSVNDIIIFFQEIKDIPIGVYLKNIKNRNELISIYSKLLNINNEILEVVINNIDNKNIVHLKMFKVLFRNYKDYRNISLLSSLEALLDENDKTSYPSCLTSHPNSKRAIQRKETFIQNTVIEEILKNTYSNTASDKIDNFSDNRVAQYNIYNLLTFDIIYDFLITFKDKKLQNLSEKDLSIFFLSKQTLTIPAIFIIDMLKNWKAYPRKANSYLNKKEIKDLKLEGFNSKGILKNNRSYKNTIFDLCEIFMSCLMFPNDEFKTVFLTRDKGCLLPMKMYMFNIKNNKMHYSATNYLNTIQKDYLYVSVSNLLDNNNFNLFENTIFARSLIKNRWIDDCNIKSIFSGISDNKERMKNMIKYVSAFSTSDEQEEEMWKSILLEKNSLEVINCLMENLNIWYNTPLEIRESLDEKYQENYLRDQLSGFGGSIIHNLSKRLILKQKELEII